MWPDGATWGFGKVVLFTKELYEWNKANRPEKIEKIKRKKIETSEEEESVTNKTIEKSNRKWEEWRSGGIRTKKRQREIIRRR